VNNRLVLARTYAVKSTPVATAARGGEAAWEARNWPTAEPSGNAELSAIKRKKLGTHLRICCPRLVPRSSAVGVAESLLGLRAEKARERNFEDGG
jgi:hypothetical protein